jgi:glycosyltransferase involved in cell wall biosynthesis
MTSTEPPVVAINTLSVTGSNEGTRTMLQCLLPALGRVAPELRQLLICSSANRHLFDHGGDVIEIPLEDRRTLRRIWCDQVTVPRLIRGRADVLVTPAGVGTLSIAVPQVMIVAAHLALPSCRRVAGPDGFSRFQQLYYGAPFRWSLNRADAVLGISRFLADGLVSELGTDRKKVYAMPLGVTFPEATHPVEGRDPLALFVGTLYGYKDPVVAVRAFGLAKARLPERARLVIAGKDPDGEIPKLRRAAAEAGVQDSVDIVGAVSDEQLEDLYARASLLVLPSRCEGFGLPVAEAMSRGIPVVVARSTSLPEVAGGAGILVEPGDAGGFAEAMVAVLSDPRRHRALAELGLARARELNWDVSAGHLRDALTAVTS